MDLENIATDAFRYPSTSLGRREQSFGPQMQKRKLTIIKAAAAGLGEPGGAGRTKNDLPSASQAVAVRSTAWIKPQIDETGQSLIVLNVSIIEREPNIPKAASEPRRTPDARWVPEFSLETRVMSRGLQREGGLWKRFQNTRISSRGS